MDKVCKEILPKLPLFYRKRLEQCSFVGLCEIRFRAEKPVMLYYCNRTCFLSVYGGETARRAEAVVVVARDIPVLVGAFCSASVYAHEQDIRAGFLTICGGHRIGLCGKAVMSGDTVLNMDQFSGVNIRIAREFTGSADRCMKYIRTENRIYNSVLISPPGFGKTTILRDIARQLSVCCKVVIVDERSELAAFYAGVSQFDVGEQTDVLDGFPKAAGIIHALRSLSPDVIITDEIGTEEDIRAVSTLLRGGCKIITSMHGYSIEEALEKKSELMKLFETAVLLDKQNGIPGVAQCLRLWE